MGIVNAINRTASWIERCASLCLATITTVVCLSALARYAFNSPIPDAHGISSLLLGIAVLWGLACVTWRDDHIGVDLLWLVCPAALRKVMDVTGLLLITVFIVLLSWKLLERVESVRASGIHTVDLRLVIWPFYLVAWLGVVAALLLAMARLWLVLFQPQALPSRQGVLDDKAGA